MSDIPSGRYLCDGTNGTPDLRDRFLTGVGSSYKLGDIGGENFHKITIDEMPKHNHSYVLDSEGVRIGGNAVADAPGRANPFMGRYSDLSTAYAGGDQPHENRPPYYAVYYIMRVK